MDQKLIFILVLIATLMISVSSTAQKARWASADDPIAKKLIAKEKMWAEANCSPQPELNVVFADEFQGTAQETVAIAYGNESSIRKGKDGKEYLRCLVWTDTWLKRDGKWQIIAAQDAVVKCPK